MKDKEIAKTICKECAIHKKDCELNVDNKEIIKFIKENLDEASENIKLHQLCDWCWLEDEHGKMIKQVAGKPLFVGTIVKYGNFIIKQDFLNKIKEHFKEYENEQRKTN